MSLIGDALNKKLSDDKSKEAFYYADYIYGDRNYTVDKYTYFDLQKKVNYFIDYINENYKDKKICFLIIENSIEDIAFFIALMELKIKPIIIHKDKLIELYLSNKDVEYMEYNPDINNIHMPFDRGYYYRKAPNYEEEAPFISNVNIRSTCYLSNIKNEIRLKKPLINKILNYYLRKNGLLDLLDQDDYDFGILTSGTTNNFKIQKVKETDLYNKIITNYDIKSEETVVNTTPISSISGLLFNLYIPLLSKNNKMVCVSLFHFFPLQDEKGVMSIVLPGGQDLFPSSGIAKGEEKKKYLKDIRFNHIYFMGKKLTLENVENVYEYVTDLSDDCIYNYYGNTENLGLICKCNQKHLKPIYLYGLSITNDQIFYSLDKKNVYLKTIENGKIITKKIDMNFDHDLFIPILPISDNYKEDSKIINIDDNVVFGELLVNDFETGDFGFEHNNLLYLVGRKNEFVQEDNRYIFLSSLENAIKKHIGQDCSIVRKDSMTNLYLICDFDFLGDFIQEKYYTSYSSLEGIKNFADKHNISIDNYTIIDKKDLPTGIEIGKIKKDFLSQYIFPKLDPNKFYMEYENVLIDILNKQLSSLLGRIVKAEKNKHHYVFDKNHFSFIDLLAIIDNYQTYGFYEDDNNYYLSIADTFILARHPNNIKKIVDDYSVFKALLGNSNRKASIKINFYHDPSTGIRYSVSNCDYLEPLTIDYNCDNQILDNSIKKDDSLDKSHLLRYMISNEKEEIRGKSQYSFDMNSYKLNVPFYFIAYMKDGKIYLDEHFKLQYKEQETSNKVYKIKK